MTALLEHNLRLWRTTRHLHFSQVAWRVKRIATRLAEQRLPMLSRRSPAVADLQPISAPCLPPLTRTSHFDVATLAEELSRGELTLLNESKRIGIQRIDWRGEFTDKDRLWNITLHYHEWIHTLLADPRTSSGKISNAAVGEGTLSSSCQKVLAHRILRDWLDQCGNPEQPSKSIAWNAYAIATRLEWWARIIERLSASTDAADTRLATDLRENMAEQASYLYRNLEWDIRANHLLRNCVGLATASQLFSGRAAEQWRRIAMRVGIQQAREQVLNDGGHYERSPMYHLETLEDFALLKHCFADEPTARQEFSETVDRMVEFARWMQHPDGCVPQFNDCSRRRVANTIDRVAETERLEPPSGFRHFAETGVACWHTPEWSIFFDIGSVGPNHQPGHAHADTLTLEASCRGERMVIDPGVGHYDPGLEREHDRATASHNTVMIDGVDSTEVWHIFRVGRRAYPQDIRVDQTEPSQSEGGAFVQASHDGYDHLPGKPRHSRSVTLGEDKILRVTDGIEGGLDHHVVGGWLLEPGWRAERANDGWMLHSATQSVRVNIQIASMAGYQPAPRMTIEPAICHFQFGHTAETIRLTWQYDGPLPLRVETEFIPLPA